MMKSTEYIKPKPIAVALNNLSSQNGLRQSLKPLIFHLSYYRGLGTAEPLHWQMEAFIFSSHSSSLEIFIDLSSWTHYSLHPQPV